MRSSLKKISDTSLAHLERFLKTDISYLVRGSFWSMAGRVSGLLAAFLLSVVYARYLPKELYGTYRYVLSLLGTFAVFSLSDIGMAITRSVARGYERTAIRGIRIMFFSSFFISLVSFGAAIFFFSRGNDAVAWGCIAAGFFVPFVEGLGGWHAYLDGKKQFKEKAFYNLFEQICYTSAVLLAVILISWAQLGLLAATAILVAAYYIGNAIPNSIYTLQIAAHAKKLQTAEEKGAMRYGLHLSMAKIPATIANHLDSILLFAYLDPIQLAVYSFALAPTEQIKTLLTNVANVSYPKFSEKTASREDRLLLQKTLPVKIAKASIVTACMVGAYIAAAPIFFHIFFPAYIDSVPFSQAISLSLILFPLGVFGTALKAEADLKSIYIYETLAPILQIIIFFLLIPTYGLWGAVVGKVVGRIATHALVTMLYLRKL